MSVGAWHTRAMPPNKQCKADGCRKQVPTPRHKYCSDTCRRRQFNRRKYAAEQKGRKLANTDKLQQRRGRVYDAIETLELYDAWDSGDFSYSDVREELARHGIEVTLEAVIISLSALKTDRKFQKLADEWEMDPEIREMLALDAPDATDDDFEAWLDEAVEAFARFRARFFKTARGPFITKGFHKAWIRSILKAILGGGQLQILAPPRHGKSELLGHFCVWLICRNPNIRILWVSGNGDIAEDMLGAVKAHLEDNNELLKAVLPPGVTFKPHQKGGKPWTAKKFTVNTSDIIGQKSATMTALGRAGKILSRDVDIIVADDIEDFASTEQEHIRTATRRWFFTQLSSRKEEHTAWVVIGSRQHHDDLYGYLDEDDEWETIVNAAHSPACELDPENVKIHIDCMLFPEIRSYRWLRSKYNTAFAMGQEDLWAMVYQNQTSEDGEGFWDRELIKNAHNYDRAIGELPKDVPVYLLGGIDPSATKHQAAYIMGLELYTGEPRQFMIDLDNRVGGGVGPLIEQFRWAHAKYGVRHWVVESNLYHGALIDDPRVQEVIAELNLIIEPHQTGSNKNDQWFGVGAMRSLYKIDGERDYCLADLPMKGAEAHQKVEILTRQMVNFSSNPLVQKRRKSDILMAKWFPQKVVRRMVAEYLAAVESAQADQVDQSFSGYDMSDYGEVPWT